jgi:histidinol-phosphate aminotransferase
MKPYEDTYYLPPLYKGNHQPGRLQIDPSWAYVPPVRTNFILNLDREETTCNTGIPLDEADRRRHDEFPIQYTNRYPTKLIEKALAKRIADKIGLRENNVLIGNGIMSLLTYLYEVYSRPGDDVTVPTPGFWPAYTYAMQRGRGIHMPTYQCDRTNPNRPFYHFPLEQVRKALAHSCLCYICNPNNPTGTLIPFSTIESLTADFPMVLFILDEAYGPFAANHFDRDSFDLTESIQAIKQGCNNLIIARTFSKVYAMANYRVGYLISDEANIETVRAHMGPYDMDEIPLAMAYYNYEENGYMKDIVRAVTKNKRLYETFLEENGIVHYGGYRNSILIEGLDLGEGYERNGIAVRSMVYQKEIPNLIGSTFRVTIPADDKNFSFFMELTKKLILDEGLPTRIRPAGSSFSS